MWLFLIFIVLCFFVPGGPLTVGFFALILTPELLLLWLLIEYVKSWFRLH
jgi:hypothetical protein